VRDPFKHNNFDLLRFLFASTVMLVHCHVLSQQPQLAFLSEWLSSEIAVRSFFVVSGLLVFMSYDKTRDLGRYAEKRLRRIYPAYFTVVAGSALLLFLVSTSDAAQYFAGGFLKYLAANLVFLNFIHPTLPGVLEGNALREVNGALWTLKIEVMFYVAVPVFAWLFARLGRLRVMVAVYVLSVAYAWAFDWLARKSGANLYVILGRQLPGQLSYFMVGGFFYYYFGFFRRHAAWFAAAALALAVLHRFVPTGPLEPLWLGTLVAVSGFFLYLGNFGRYGDFSYGIYILHFPILQALIQAGLFAWSPFGALAIACGTVIAAAALLWHLVERPFLARSSHYVEAVEKPSAVATT
jgi:peptidoglycan/LPS O-acetylase OafA/YrhL